MKLYYTVATKLLDILMTYIKGLQHFLYLLIVMVNLYYIYKHSTGNDLIDKEVDCYL